MDALCGKGRVGIALGRVGDVADWFAHAFEIGSVA
jgi:hypothetical protein